MRKRTIKNLEIFNAFFLLKNTKNKRADILIRPFALFLPSKLKKKGDFYEKNSNYSFIGFIDFFYVGLRKLRYDEQGRVRS